MAQVGLWAGWALTAAALLAQSRTLAHTRAELIQKQEELTQKEDAFHRETSLGIFLEKYGLTSEINSAYLAEKEASEGDWTQLSSEQRNMMCDLIYIRTVEKALISKIPQLHQEGEGSEQEAEYSV